MANSPEQADLAARVARALAEEIVPTLKMDGASIELIEVVDGVARLRARGVCGACPGTVMAVIMGIEQELRRRVPEIGYIELVP
jgi:Fe-S cluster biogenesis protein NfuA